MNPAVDELNAEPHLNGAEQHGSDSNLQLAQIYSHPRHLEGRESVDDILSRFHSRGNPSYQDYTYPDSYDENLETHFGVDEHGAHVGVCMSRTQQTPFGDARSDVGMQMRFGNHGLEVRTTSSTFLGRGGRSPSMLCYSMGSRYTSPLSLFFQPSDCTGMRFPFGGLFSPFRGMYSPALASHSYNQDSSLFESGGPIIEEMFDEDLGLIDEVNSMSHPMIKERDDKIDPSLELGLIPDSETADHGSDENIQDEEKSESVQFSEGVSKNFTDSEASNLPKIFTDHSRRIDIEETGPAEFNTERPFKESQAPVSKFYKNSEEKHFVEDVLTDMPGYSKANKSAGDTKSDIRFETRGKSKFTKQDFKDVPLKLKEKDARLPFVVCFSEENRPLEEGQSNQPSSSGLVSGMTSSNSNKHRKSNTLNKNTLSRHRNETFYVLPEQDSKFDVDSFQSVRSLNTVSVSPHEIPSSRDRDSEGQKEKNIHGAHSNKATLSSQENNLQSGNIPFSVSETNGDLLNDSSKKIEEKSKSSLESCENHGEDFNSDDMKMISETATKSNLSLRVPKQEIANTEENFDFDNMASTKIQTSTLKVVKGVKFDSFQEMPMRSELKENKNEEQLATGKLEKSTVSIEQDSFVTQCVPNSDKCLFGQEEYCKDKQNNYPRQENEQVSNNNESTRNYFSGNINHKVISKDPNNHHKCAKCLLEENCGHKHLHMHKCCHRCVYVCNDCGKHIVDGDSTSIQLGTNGDGIYDHPDWQYLKEYTSQIDQFENLPQNPVKEKVNKNASVKPGVSTSESKQGQTSINKGTRQSSLYNQTNCFSYLVETVGLVMQDVYPDGNCLFASICDQLRIRGDFSYTPRYLRRAAVNFLREHPNQEDGTPLVEFLTDEERNWEKYLNAMSRDGEWGDHFVIWALAYVLNKRIVIYAGNSELQKTVVEPMSLMKDNNKTEIVEHPDDESFNADIDKDRQVIPNPGNKLDEPFQNVDEINLGHVWQSHYVSLRPNNWHSKLFEVLKKKETSALIGSNPESMKLECEMFQDQDVPHAHLNFAIKIIRVNEIVYLRLKREFATRNYGSDSYHMEVYTPELDVMCAVVPGSKYRERFGKPKCFTIPTDTRVYNLESRNKAGVKDLLFDTDKSDTGCTKLKAIDPVCWINSLDGDRYLKHLLLSPSSGMTSTDSEMTLAFYCEWPDIYGDWLTRKREHNWPQQTVIDIIKQSGCRVVPHDKSSPVEWEIVFYQAEKVVSEQAVTDEQIECFIFTKLILDNNLDNPLTLQQMKHVFFYMCEDTDEDLWKYDLSKCVCLFLGRLKDCLQCRKIPNYFLPDINLLDDSMTDELVCKALERIEIVQRHPFVALYFICSNYAHAFRSIKDLFDMLIEDSMMYAVDKNLDMSLRECFLPLVGKSLYYLVDKHRYKEALEGSKNATEQLHLLVLSKRGVHLEDVIDEVMFQSSRKLLNKWLFAFCADQELGTIFIETACEGLHGDKKTASVVDYYGQSAVENFELLTGDMDILIPEELVALPKLAETTFHFLELLESICDEDVCVGVLDYFNSHHLNRLLYFASTMPPSSLPVTYLDKVVKMMNEYKIV